MIHVLHTILTYVNVYVAVFFKNVLCWHILSMSAGLNSNFKIVYFYL